MVVGGGSSVPAGAESHLTSSEEEEEQEASVEVRGCSGSGSRSKSGEAAGRTLSMTNKKEKCIHLLTKVQRYNAASKQPQSLTTPANAPFCKALYNIAPEAPVAL